MQEEEVQVRKVRALFGVVLRAGMERSAGEGLSTCGKGISVALGCLSLLGASNLRLRGEVVVGGREGELHCCQTRDIPQS